MKVIRSGETVETRIGETFAVIRAGNELSGYATELLVPNGISIVETKREPRSGFGGKSEVKTLFRCDHAGTYRISLSEGRPWEGEKSQSILAWVSCTRR